MSHESGQQLLGAWCTQHDWHAVACLCWRLKQTHQQAFMLKVPVSLKPSDQQKLSQHCALASAMSRQKQSACCEALKLWHRASSQTSAMCCHTIK